MSSSTSQNPRRCGFWTVASRALKPGGRLIVQTPNGETPWGAVLGTLISRTRSALGQRRFARSCACVASLRQWLVELGPVPSGCSRHFNGPLPPVAGASLGPERVESRRNWDGWPRCLDGGLPCLSSAPAKPMLRILYVGALWSGATSAQRKQAFSELGHRVLGVDTEPPSTLRLERRLLYRIESRVLKSGLVPGHAGIPDRAKANLQLLERIQQDQFDVLWLDRGLRSVRPPWRR